MTIIWKQWVTASYKKSEQIGLPEYDSSIWHYQRLLKKFCESTDTNIFHNGSRNCKSLATEEGKHTKHNDVGQQVSGIAARGGEVKLQYFLYRKWLQEL